MTARRNSGLLELSEMRLPLIALIDVILFLLMYFLLAGSLESEERELAATLGSGSPVAGDSGGFTAQVVEVGWDGKRAVFRIGARPAMGRDAVVEVLRALPERCRHAAMPGSRGWRTSPGRVACRNQDLG
jgi:biopolymer transport protein ExbD